MHPDSMGAVLFATVLATGNSVAMTADHLNHIVMPPFTTLQLAQSTPTFTERVDQIDTCRGTGEAVVTMHKSSALNSAIGTIPPNSSVTLTGIFGAGVVQIKAPQLGWIATTTLLANCGGAPDGGLPPDIDTNPQYCRRLRSAQVDGTAYADLDGGLIARNTPNGTFQYVGSSNQTDGPTRGAVVRFSGRAGDLQDAGDRRWIRIKYQSILSTPRVGWVPNGASGVNRNIAACSGNQN